MANTFAVGLVEKALGLEDRRRRIREDDLLLDEVLRRMTLVGNCPLPLLCTRKKTGFRPRSGRDENSLPIHRWDQVARIDNQSAKRTTDTCSAVRLAD